jgi:hypothetical protein
MNARHTAGEGSFARSAGGAAGRGIVLVVVAVLIGIALMRWALDGPGDGEVVTDGPVTTADGSTDGTADTTPATGPDGSTVPPNTTETSTPPAVAPETVKVLVANGTSIQGAARSFTDQLNTQNYVSLTATNADTNTYTVSHVYYVAGNADAQTGAQQVGTLLNVQTPPEPMPATVPLSDPAALADAMVLVVIGTDLAQPPA